MTITTDQAIALAREFGLKRNGQWCFDEEELQDMLTYFANKVREQTLLEAAEYVNRNLMSAKEYADELRRMARGE